MGTHTAMRDQGEWTLEDVIAHYKRNNLPLPKELRGKALPPEQADQKASTPKPSKMRNIKVDEDGETYDSRREHRRWKELQLMIRAGEIVAVARQVWFRLAEKISYVADFVILWPDGHYTVEDAKGRRTDVYIIKKKLMKQKLNIDIVEV